MSQIEAMKRFMVMQPSSFNGEPNAEAAEHWLRRMKRILVGLDIPEERRVSLVACMLVDKADFWWESMKRVYDTEMMIWEEFERTFLSKYFGEVAKHAKRMEFEHLIQGTMSVQEYESRFSELSRFALRMISEEGEKARRTLRRPTKFESKEGIEKGNKEWGKSSRAIGPTTEAEERTAGSTSVSGRFSAAAGSAFLAPSLSVALLPDATFTPSNAESQDNYHEAFIDCHRRRIIFCLPDGFEVCLLEGSVLVCLFRSRSVLSVCVEEGSINFLACLRGKEKPRRTLQKFQCEKVFRMYSQMSYQDGPLELKELKTQLEELVEKLNRVTVKNKYPLPRIDDLFDQLKVDNILIYSRSLEEHKQHLVTILRTLKDISCMGKLGKRIAVDHSKVEAVQEWQRLTNVFEVRSFLGLAGYYRRMCANAAGKVVAYASRQLKQHEWNYPTHDLELAAVVQRRWMETLEDYDFALHYHSGKVNVIADALSRKSYGQLSSFGLREFEMHAVIEDFELCLGWEGHVKAEHQRSVGLLQPLLVLEWKWDHITMDFVMGLPRTRSKKNGVWVIVDHLTKSSHFLAMKTTDSMNSLAKLYIQEIVRLHGIPLSILSDKDPKFTSQFWQSLQRALGTQLNFSIAFHS
ncbi:Transposon Ty3-I Gag-Pol polyprotein [Vitis vinifera]|uniref:Transposon Ty3-I Gag-Pol polyprotein n=1 Tax=Vitis vinifera TaxID=29760 RepID=A0A438E2H1_VITVI|nr:Transposon Ty3-I Gag-Pol polyprotein [Vitis vinifera]